jgi:hypothetical protein
VGSARSFVEAVSKVVLRTCTSRLSNRRIRHAQPGRPSHSLTLFFLKQHTPSHHGASLYGFHKKLGYKNWCCDPSRENCASWPNIFPSIQIRNFDRQRHGLLPEHSLDSEVKYLHNLDKLFLRCRIIPHTLVYRISISCNLEQGYHTVLARTTTVTGLLGGQGSIQTAESPDGRHRG